MFPLFWRLFQTLKMWHMHEKGGDMTTLWPGVNLWNIPLLYRKYCRISWLKSCSRKFPSKMLDMLTYSTSSLSDCESRNRLSEQTYTSAQIKGSKIQNASRGRRWGSRFRDFVAIQGSLKRRSWGAEVPSTWKEKGDAAIWQAPTNSHQFD